MNVSKMKPSWRNLNWSKLGKIAAVLVVVAASLAFLASRGQPTVTRPRLERALPAVFTQLYAEQAAIMGRSDLDLKNLKPQAMCDKHGPLVADVGPGGDWTCLMSWHDPKVPMPPEGWGKFELNVHANDCFTATGPTKLTGYLTITDSSGRDVTNPLFEFDSCFDPHADNTPTGVEFPSLLAVPPPLVPLVPDSSGSVAIPLTCALGAGGCEGTVQAVTKEGKALVDQSYQSEEGRNIIVTFPDVPKTTALTLTVIPSKGIGPADPVEVPLGGS